MHLPACDVKFYGIVHGGYVELLSPPLSLLLQSLPFSVTDGVRQEELLHTGLPPVEDDVHCSNTAQRYWVRGTSGVRP